jgi:16S rRNA (uracil1498-N3)-methyltransferase
LIATEPVLSLQDLPRSSAIELVIGPEGGWAPGEIAAARQSGSMLVTLRSATLRADAAPLVVVSALRAIWNDL